MDIITTNNTGVESGTLDSAGANVAASIEYINRKFKEKMVLVTCCVDNGIRKKRTVWMKPEIATRACVSLYLCIFESAAVNSLGAREIEPEPTVSIINHRTLVKFAPANRQTSFAIISCIVIFFRAAAMVSEDEGSLGCRGWPGSWGGRDLSEH
ncbi:50S ribosomal protein L22 [Striga asiatica]|uniref:50S ribosomal protein L22 n=1 Tax=Striga asiatica TaxID=4170 RepID=A0A5A7Q1J6_STRAF|nr:50S ribosomal protein L22 [Striga asiatica]